MLKVIKESYSILAGFFLYHFAPRKTIVLITGSMRSGTTLLKAPLAEAPDISHLPEVNYSKYAKYNKYRSYWEIYNLSKNGNTLICETFKGHVFEVTHDGKLVWEFWNPEIDEEKNKRARIYRMMRIIDPEKYPLLKGKL